MELGVLKINYSVFLNNKVYPYCWRQADSDNFRSFVIPSAFVGHPAFSRCKKTWIPAKSMRESQPARSDFFIYDFVLCTALPQTLGIIIKMQCSLRLAAGHV